MHLVKSFEDIVPAGHALHVGEPASEYCPGLHFVHEAELATEKVPTGVPLLAFTFPVTQGDVNLASPSSKYVTVKPY